MNVRGLMAVAGAVIIFVAVTPASSDAQLALGDSLWDAGRLAEASAAYTRALEEDKLSVRPNIRLARTLAWAGKTDSALALLRNARMRVPDDADVRYSEALYLSWARRFDEALARYDSLIVLYPDLDYVRVGRARTLSWASRLDEAEVAYHELLARPPTDKDAARDAEFGLSQVTSWRGSLVSAAKQFDALLTDDPGDPRALQGLASVRTWQGRPLATVALLERALKRDSTNGELRVLLASARTAASPGANVDVRWSDDSDGNQNVWWTVSQSVYLSERVRGVVNGGVLQESDPARHSQRSHVEAAINVNMDRVRLGGALGVRKLNVGTIAAVGAESGDRSTMTARANATTRLPANVNVGVGISRFSLDEVPGLVAKALDVTLFDVNADYTPTSGLTFGLNTNAMQVTDGNHRTSVSVRGSQRLPARFSIGALARQMRFAETRQGYFSPSRFSLYELQGGWAHENDRWASSIGAGYGTQSIGPSKPWQDEYHTDASLARRWKNGNEVALNGEISTSAASSVVGAFRYRTVGLRATLVW
ncbi:MAG: tetratricopeptide repeat protein [bacterium]